MASKKIKTSFNVYLLVWVIYSFNGVFYEPSGILARLSALIIMLISLYNVILVNIKYNFCPYIKGLNFLLVIFTIYGVVFLFDPFVIYNKSGLPTPHYIFIKTIYLALLPFYSFYFYTVEGVLTKKKLITLIPLLLFVAGVKFVDNQLTRMEKMGTDIEGVTNNMGYQFVALLPFAFLLDKKRIYQYIFLIVSFIFTLVAVKRGAILISGVWLMWFVLCSIKNAKKNTKIFMVFGSFFLIVVIFLVFQYLIGHNAYFASRLETTSSGDMGERDFIYMYMLDWYLNQNTIDGIIFGNGAYTSIKLLLMPAHNDWLEIALAQGVVGIISYIIYWLSLGKTAFIQLRTDCLLAYQITISFLIIFLMKSFFSMSYASIPFSATLILGFAIAQGNKKQHSFISKLKRIND